MRLGLTFLLSLLVAMYAACSSDVPPTVTYRPQAPIPRDATIFVLATHQRERIVESIQKAGLAVAESWGDSDYVLDVRLGSSRGSSTCGTIHNVTYVLKRGSARAIVIKGRGVTGSCVPNIFDDMSVTLASFSTPLKAP
jgi:hypothetical protein